MKETVSKYLYLTKPGIVYGNVLTILAGYFFGSAWNIQIANFILVIFGSGFVIGGAGVFNNLIDRDIDKYMQRTKNRASVLGTISTMEGIIYGTILSLLGFLLLAYINRLVFILGLIGFFDYVIIYDFCKRRSIYGTLIGSISGSIPLVSGYVASTNRIDLTFWILFLIMTTWQMAHFLGIGIYRLSDYRKAKIPLLPIVKGVSRTKIEINVYILLFLVLNIVLFISQKLSIFYLIVMGLSGIFWLIKALGGFNASNDKIWGKLIFKQSIIIIMIFSVMLSVVKLI